MPISYSAAASLFRATNKDRMEIKKIGFRSDGKEEFQASINFSDITDQPNLPMSVASPNIRSIKFLGLICSGGGTAMVRIVSGSEPGRFIDIPLTNGSLLLSGTDLTGVILLSVSGLGYLEAYGSGD